MESSLNNIYLFKALDAYPFDLEETVESLNYALTYDEKDARALRLMGRLYAEQLGDLETAESYYAEALANAMEWPMIYPEYIRLLTNKGDLDKAENLFEFALKQSFTVKAMLHLVGGQLYERQQRFNKAIKAFKKAKKIAGNDDFFNFVAAEIKRVARKMPKKKKRKKAKRKKSKAKKGKSKK
ncbi:MAG: tetratricopeptide repeat protein [Leeuwenhoekiella sp.]